LKYEVRLSRRADRERASLEQSTCRIRVGDYMVLYEVVREEEMVLVDKIDHRSDVYGP
jgi:mRNA-degrading endonuclease RelE of RelBE toxin-antitoxin system